MLEIIKKSLLSFYINYCTQQNTMINEEMTFFKEWASSLTNYAYIDMHYLETRKVTPSRSDLDFMLHPLFSSTPMIYMLIALMLLFITYFSFNLKYKIFYYKINYALLFYFVFIIFRMVRRGSISIDSSFQKIYDSYTIHNNYFQLFSYYISKNMFLFLFFLIIIVITFLYFFNIKKNSFYTLVNRKYISYLVAIYISLIILFYTINTDMLYSSSFNFLNTIIILECFTILTIYITMNVNINILNSLIIYFFYSVFGYLFFIISCSLYIYVNGSDLVSIVPSISNEYFKFLSINYYNIINISNFLFFISFSLKLYLFPFSNIIDKLYSSINISEIILISFFFVPILYLITIQFLSIINWFTYNNQNNVIIIFLSIITFLYSITLAVDKSNLKSLIAYSSINTSSLFVLFISLSNNTTIEWFNFFYLYQIVYLMVLILFISMILNVKKNVLNQSNFVNISNSLINSKLMYIVIMLMVLSITMVLPPLFFIKIELVSSFVYLQSFQEINIYNTIFIFAVIIYTTSSYIFYIRVFKAFKLINLNELNDRKQITNKKILNLFKKNEL